MNDSRQQIKDPSTRKIPLSAHLSECAGNKENYFTLFPFYKFPINATEQHRIIKKQNSLNKAYRPNAHLLYIVMQYNGNVIHYYYYHLNKL